MFHNKPFGNDLIYFVELDTYINSERKDYKKNIRKMTNLEEQTFILSKRLTWWTTADEDVSMDTLLKLAYMVSTSDPKIKGRIEFHEGYKFRNVGETRQMITELGRAILDSREAYDIPKLYKYFVKSDPLLWSRFDDVNNDTELLVGLVALKFYAFISNDRRIQKRVRKMTER
jgi:hypothetical protein